MTKLYYRVTDDCDRNCNFCFYRVYNDEMKRLVNRDYVSINNIVSSIAPTSIMISGGEPGTRDDIIELLCALKQCCENISVFTNGLFIEKYYDFIMQSEWKKLKFQVSIPSNGLKDSITDKISMLVENGYCVDGYIVVDSEFVKSRAFIEKWKCYFSRLFFQPLVVPQNHYLYKNTLNSCSKKQIKTIVEMMCEYSPHCAKFYRYLEHYYNDNLREYISNSNATCEVGKSAYFMNSDLSFSRCLHSNLSNEGNYPLARECYSDRCICLAKIFIDEN